MRSVQSLKTQSPTVIVGAGVSGLWLSRLLKQNNHQSIIYEKSNVYGGRMATRASYINPNAVKFDTGAQYYSLKEPMNSINEHWQREDKDNNPITPTVWFHKDKVARFRSINGMSNLAKTIAVSNHINNDNLNIEFKQRVSIIKRVSNPNTLINKRCKWLLYFENNTTEPVECERVILTCPLPQSLDILKDSDIAFDPMLSSIDYAKALVGLYELNPDYTNDNDRLNSGSDMADSACNTVSDTASMIASTQSTTAGNSAEVTADHNNNSSSNSNGVVATNTIGLNLVGNPLVKEDSDGFYTMTSNTSIYSIIDQQRKGLSSLPAWTVIMHPDFSERYYSSPEAEVMEAIHQELLRVDPSFRYSQYASIDGTNNRNKNNSINSSSNGSSISGSMKTTAPLYGHLKRWKFSHPTSTYKEPFIEVEDGLYLAGDSFGGGSINGAVISANALAIHLKMNSS